MFEANFNLKTCNINAFSKEIPEPFKSCNKNMMQQSTGSKWVQVDRKMQKAFKKCAFTAIQGKGLFILQEIQHMQMSLFPYFFFHKTTSTLER